MKKIDSIFAWIMLLLGCAHCAVTFAVHKSLTAEAIWFVSAGLAMVFGALLNMVRIARSGDRLIAAVSTLANLLLFAVFVIALTWIVRHELKQNPQVIAVGLAVIVELVFSLKLFLSK